jgi:hypothetical protein
MARNHRTSSEIGVTQHTQARKKPAAAGKGARGKKARGRDAAIARRPAAVSPTAIDELGVEMSAVDDSELARIKDLPKEIGVMLITAGILGIILPGPGTPAVIAGGLALWPSAFGKLESWLERRYPRVHRESMKQINRFLNDLEKRYPYSGGK